ncbi:hypothetical protein B0T17DRAFT_543344, partial [Bombardia bombarda]
MQPMLLSCLSQLIGRSGVSAWRGKTQLVLGQSNKPRYLMFVDTGITLVFCVLLRSSYLNNGCTVGEMKTLWSKCLPTGADQGSAAQVHTIQGSADMLSMY